MGKIGEYYAQLGVHGLSGVHAAFASVRRGLTGLASASVWPIRSVGGALAGLANPIGLAAAALGAAGVAGTAGIMKLAADTEALATQFRVLLGSADAAAAMMAQINKFAAETPFEQAELGLVAKQLLATGTAADQIIPTMRRLGDVAALSGADLGDLAAIYGKIKEKGRMTADTLEAWQTRGIPITRELAAVMGVAQSEISGLVSKGEIGFAEVQAAIARLTDSGGQYAGGMAQLAQTTGGLWSTVTGNLKTAMADLGASIIETFDIKNLLASAGQWLDSLGGRIRAFFAEWGPLLRQTAATVASVMQMIFEIEVGIYSSLYSWIGSLLGLTSDSFASAAADWLAEIEFFAANWRESFALSWEIWKLFFANTWERIKTFFVNVGVLLAWMVRNWRGILTDIWNLNVTIFSNLITNLKNLWSALLTWLKGGGWQFDWTPLTDGFESAIKEMPQFATAAVRQTTPEIERMTAELARRREEFYARKRAKATEATPAATPAATEAAAAAAPGTPAAKAATAASPAAAAQAAKQAGEAARFNFVALEALANTMQEEAGKRLEEQQLAEAQRTAENTDRLAGAVSGGAVRVQIVGGTAAAYA